MEAVTSSHRLRKVIPWVSALAASTVLAMASVSFWMTLRARHREQERVAVVSRAGTLRARLEGELNSRLLLGKGLVAYLSINPVQTEEQFALYVRLLVKDDPVIRNISLLEDTTIRHAYPLESNKAAIGVDLTSIASQRDGVLWVKTSGKPLIISGVKLVQGGVGTVFRMPVFHESSGRYRGQVGLVLMEDALFKAAGVGDEDNGLQYCLMNSKGGIITGVSSVMNRRPVELRVVFPYGHWTLAAAPAGGWGRQMGFANLYLALGLLLSLATGVLAFLVMRSRYRIHQLEQFLPICSSCKRIRGPHGEWNEVEVFFNAASSIEFSHGLCDSCMDKLYGAERWYKKP